MTLVLLISCANVANLMLARALTHRSKAHEAATGSTIDNESLEFLGDAILGALVCEILYHQYPE